MSRGSKTAIVLVVVLIVLALAIAVALNQDSSTGTSGDDSLNDGKLTVTLVGTVDYDQAQENGTLNPSYIAARPAPEGTHYILVLMEANNTGDQNIELKLNSWTGWLSNGTAIQPTSGWDGTGSAATANVSPGDVSYPVVAFEVPDGLNLAKVTFVSVEGEGTVELPG